MHFPKELIDSIAYTHATSMHASMRTRCNRASLLLYSLLILRN